MLFRFRMKISIMVMIEKRLDLPSALGTKEVDRAKCGQQRYLAQEKLCISAISE